MRVRPGAVSVLPGALALLAVGGLVSLPSCTGGDPRELVSGSGLQGKEVRSSDDEGSGGKGAQGGSDAGGSTGGDSGDNVSDSTDTSSGGTATGRSLEQCTAEGKAWIAVVESGAKPAECGDPLVDWCCTKEEALARFPTMAGALAPKIDQAIADGFVLYHCSKSGDKEHKLHFGKIGAQSIAYYYISISDVFETDTGNDATNCPVITTDDLREDGAVDGGGDDGADDDGGEDDDAEDEKTDDDGGEDDA